MLTPDEEVQIVRILSQACRVLAKQFSRSVGDFVHKNVLRGVRKGVAIEMYVAGLSFREIAEMLGLSGAAVRRQIILPAISQGEITQRPRGAKRNRYPKRKKTILLEADGTMTPLSRSVLSLRKQGLSQRAVGRILGVSGERVRQWLGTLAQHFGNDILESGTLCFAKAVERLGLTWYSLGLLCQSGEISYIQNIYTRRIFFTPDDLFYCQEYLIRRKQKICSICGKAYTVKIKFHDMTKSSPSAHCRRPRCRQIYYEQRFQSSPHPERLLKDWRKEVYLRLKDGVIGPDAAEEDNDWIGLKEMCEKSELTKMQIGYLGRRRIIAKRPSADRQWRGKPVTLYSRAQAEIIRQVRIGHPDS